MIRPIRIEDAAAVAEGALLGNYVYDRPGTSKDAIKAPVATVEIATSARGKAAKDALGRAEITARGYVVEDTPQGPKVSKK